jgi:hypothetical protein
MWPGSCSGPIFMHASARFSFSVLCAACTSGSGGSIAGHVPGGSFDVAGAISAAITIPDGAGGTSNNASIIIASTSHPCGDAGASPPIDRKGSRSLTIALRDVDGATTAVPGAPGTYTIYPDTGSEPPKAASLATTGLDASCQLVDSETANAQTGTVTLTSIRGGVFAGHFDVVLDTGDHITGSFDPEACPGLEAEATGTSTHACM